MSLETKIKTLGLDGEVLASEHDRMLAAYDASIFEVVPEVVVKPKTVEDVKKLVRFAATEKPHNPKISLTARAAGTCMSGGSLNESIILDFTANLNRIGQVGDAWAEVEPGAYWRDFEKATLKHNLIMPSYPASKHLCAVGGVVANNSGGEKSLSYGKTENYVEELHVVLSDGNEYVIKPLHEKDLEIKLKLSTFEGELYRKIYHLINSNYEMLAAAKPKVSKNSAGYYLWNVWDKKDRIFNLCKLIVGSQGTLGIITKVKFALVRPKPKAKLLVMFLNDISQLGKIIDEVLTFKPETFESYDNHTFSLAMRFLPGILKRMKGNAVKLFFQFMPEIGMVLTGGVPKLVLIAEFTGYDDQSVNSQALAAQKAIMGKFKLKTHITKNEQEASKYWTVRRESFNLLRQHVSGKHTAPFIDDITVRPEFLPEFLPALNEIFKRYPSLIYTVAGHMGDGNFHIIPLMDLSNPKERELIPKISEEVYDLVLKHNGSIDAEHNDGIIRTPYLEKMFGKDIMGLFKETKQIFDPLNIFNPGKKVGGTLKYAMSHIRQKY